MAFIFIHRHALLHLLASLHKKKNKPWQTAQSSCLFVNFWPTQFMQLKNRGQPCHGHVNDASVFYFLHSTVYTHVHTCSLHHPCVQCSSGPLPCNKAAPCRNCQVLQAALEKHKPTDEVGKVTSHKNSGLLANLVRTTRALYTRMTQALLVPDMDSAAQSCHFKISLLKFDSEKKIMAAFSFRCFRPHTVSLLRTHVIFGDASRYSVWGPYGLHVES